MQLPCSNSGEVYTFSSQLCKSIVGMLQHELPSCGHRGRALGIAAIKAILEWLWELEWIWPALLERKCRPGLAGHPRRNFQSTTKAGMVHEVGVGLFEGIVGVRQLPAWNCSNKGNSRVALGARVDLANPAREEIRSRLAGHPRRNF
ncbi:hypothetical protein Nepgr_025694 [Nepenthes gracilis]|uniref:Uncharacterized protein n=1 Tax=Nepenthes gracilis TaxID=150966 RepID=A0AAD3Y1S8_NEPGR|nr:hypothetical protein Nepgr_025694 [Nepenthes gracilis]